MLNVEEWMDIHLLARQGHSIRAIARMTGLSRNTVRRALNQKMPQPFRQPERPSHLDPYKPYLKQRFEEFRQRKQLLKDVDAILKEADVE